MKWSFDIGDFKLGNWMFQVTDFVGEDLTWDGLAFLRPQYLCKRFHVLL
jgi:hypothetical protein